MICSTNPKAENLFNAFLAQATKEQNNAYIIGKSSAVKNFRLAKTLLKEVSWGLQIQSKGSSPLYTMRYSKKQQQEVSDYIKTLCRGLFIRNVDKANPGIPELHFFDYHRLALLGKESALDPIKRVIAVNGGNFVQQWSGYVSYFGSLVAESKSKGYVYIQFYDSVGFWAIFK